LEVAFLLVVAVSATLGWLLRCTVSAKLGGLLLATGLAAFVLVIAAVGLAFTGLVTVIGAGLLALIPLSVTALVLPFAIAARWGKS